MSSKTDIYIKDMDLTEDLRDYIEKKADKLDKFLNLIDEKRIDLSYVKTAREPENKFVAQITLRGRGFILRAEERAPEIKIAVDNVLDKIERQIERYKGKRFKSRAGAVPAAELFKQEQEVEQEESQQPLIARRKKFNLIPMDELEAIEQMNLLGHEDFFIFYNVNTSSINVLYKRRDGTYGLIEPVLG
jgi:putative sigma-54 modulation protein